MRNNYWWAETSKDLISELGKWTLDDTFNSNNPIRRAQIRNFKSYYSGVLDFDDFDSNLNYTGEQGELVKVAMPLARSIIRQIVAIITKQKLSFQASALNDKEVVLDAIAMANSWQEKIVFEQELNKRFSEMTEQSLIFGECFIKASWRTDRGEMYMADDLNNPIYKGDVDISVINFNDIFYDYSIEDWKNVDWCVVRVKRNKWDLASQHPNLRDKIIALPSYQQSNKYSYLDSKIQRSDDQVMVFEAYHKPTPAIPSGRLIIYSDADTVYYDGANIYDSLPVIKVIPEKIYMINGGYPLYTALMGAQELIDAMVSALATNQSAFAVQNILCPRNAGMSVENLDGMNFISYTPDSNGGKPEALMLQQSSPQTFQTVDMLKADMLTMSNLNGALRGTPPAGATSGVAIATLSANALEFLTSAASSIFDGLERIMKTSLFIFQKFATVERKILVTGKDKQIVEKAFTGKDLKNIIDMKIQAVNPFMATPAGRFEIAQNLLQSGLIKRPEKYLEILEGAPISKLTEDEYSELKLINKENEALQSGETPIVLQTDDHDLHIYEHRKLLNVFESRYNMEYLERVNNHILEHLEKLPLTSPLMLQIIKTGSVQQMPQMGMPPPDQMTGEQAQNLPAPPEGEQQELNSSGPAAMPAKDKLGRI